MEKSVDEHEICKLPDLPIWTAFKLTYPKCHCMGYTKPGYISCPKRFEVISQTNLASPTKE